MFKIPQSLSNWLTSAGFGTIQSELQTHSGSGSVVGIANGYGLDGSAIEFLWGRDFPHLSKPALGPPSPLYNGYRVFPGAKERPAGDADPSPPSSAVVMKEYSYTSTSRMGRTACTEPQCLYKGALYLFLQTQTSQQTINSPSSKQPATGACCCAGWQRTFPVPTVKCCGWRVPRC